MIEWKDQFILTEKDGPIVNIQNVVATAALPHEIDLNAIVKALPEVEYRPETFPGVVMRQKHPKTAMLIFHSGKMVCTGAKSEKGARKAIRKATKTLKRVGLIIIGRPTVNIENIVATSDLMGTVDLIEFYQSRKIMGGHILYEPDQFPGLIYRMVNPKAVFLVFHSGKVVCTGTKNEQGAMKAVKKLWTLVEESEVLT